MIAQRIFRGETAEQIGINPDQYASRKATLDRYLQQSDGTFDQASYLSWLQTDEAGWSPDQPSRGVGDTVARITSAFGIKPCGGCKARQKSLNEKFPYKAKIERV
jgi:hypothetical protein